MRIALALVGGLVLAGCFHSPAAESRPSDAGAAAVGPIPLESGAYTVTVALTADTCQPPAVLPPVMGFRYLAQEDGGFQPFAVPEPRFGPSDLVDACSFPFETWEMNAESLAVSGPHLYMSGQQAITWRAWTPTSAEFELAWVWTAPPPSTWSCANAGLDGGCLLQAPQGACTLTETVTYELVQNCPHPCDVAAPDGGCSNSVSCTCTSP